jgi:hypothetical protein
MQTLEIGKPHPGFVQGKEGNEMRWDAGGLTYTVLYAAPTAEEISAFKDGAVTVKYVALDGVLMFAMRYGGLSWQDCPYFVQPGLADVVPGDVEDGQGLGLSTVLVDASSGIVKVLRLKGLSTNFTRSLVKTMSGIDPKSQAEYDGAYAAILRKYTTGDIVKLAVATSK